MRGGHAALLRNDRFPKGVRPALPTATSMGPVIRPSRLRGGAERSSATAEVLAVGVGSVICGRTVGPFSVVRLRRTYRGYGSLTTPR